MNYRFSLLKAVAFCLAAVGCIANGQTAGANPPGALRETFSLDANWKFHLGDIPLNSFPGGQGITLYGPDFTHSDAKAGHTWGAAARGFDDKNWRQVNLPHDWAVEHRSTQKRKSSKATVRAASVGIAGLSSSIPSDRGKNIELQFDGVATHCAVYFNGTPVASQLVRLHVVLH